MHCKNIYINFYHNNVHFFLSYLRYGSMEGGTRRKNATRETTSTLKAWLQEHRKNPYPTKGEKIMLAIITKMTLTQVSTWFANARRRLKKENKMTWPPRNKGSDDKKYDDDDEDGSQEDQIKSETNDDGQSHYILHKSLGPFFIVIFKVKLFCLELSEQAPAQTFKNLAAGITVKKVTYIGKLFSKF